jgi:hypothetical protein
MRVLFIFIFCVFQLLALGQMKLLKEFSVKNPQILCSDELGNYYVSDGQEILKYNFKDSLFMRYSALNLGTISSIDVTNPLKILVFYKEISRIAFMDNTLSNYSETLDLQDLGLDQATLACTSYDNGIWIYDRMNFQLIRFNKKFEKQYRTQNLNIIVKSDFMPNFMLEKENFLYVNDPQSGIAVFDAFGGYLKTIPITGLTSFQVTQNKINYIKNGQYCSFDMKKLIETKIELNDSNVKAARVEGDKIIILTDNFLKIYKLT